MLRDIQVHRFKAFVRSPALAGELMAKIFMGIGMLYFLILFGLLAFFLPEILGALSEEAGRPELIFGSFFLYYLMIDLLARLFFQRVPGLNYPYYALSPIKKKKLINSLLLTSIFNAFCLAGLLLMLPFLVRYMIPELGLITSGIWLTGVIMAILFNHYLAVWLKFLIDDKPGLIPGLFIGAVLLVGLEYLEIISIQSLSFFFFGENLIKGFSLLFQGGAIVLAFLTARSLMLQMVYSEAVQSTQRKTRSLFAFTQEIEGMVPTLFFQELILIFRNKRTRKMMFFAPIVVALFIYQYHIIIFPDFPAGERDSFMFVSGAFFLFFSLGFWLMSYGQFLTAWESSFFDGLSTLPIDLRDYILSKWLILAVPITFFYLLLMPFAVLVWSNVLQFTAIWIFLCGPVCLVVLLAALFNKKRIALNMSGMMNSQGASSLQVIILPTILLLLFSSIIPFLIYDYETLGWLLWLAMGSIVIFSHSFWLSMLVMMYRKVRHKKLDNFRKMIG